MSPLRQFGGHSISPDKEALMPHHFAFGDQIRNTARPEWGVGTVVRLEPGGKLAVRFESAGLKQLDPKVAPLAAASADQPGMEAWEPPAAAFFRSEEVALSTSARQKLLIEVMTRLPESVTDPFQPVQARIRACASLYRFGNDSAGLMGWAVAQTGLQDPMEQLPRHELESLFGRWREVRDRALRELKSLSPEDWKKIPEDHRREVERQVSASRGPVRS
ncbi:MAG: hypothetical protein CMJ30_00020 [Phycisphaerae bacterium]|jgi:hypothetical protein|nr:hypothetical protein [Phycisphaerae bacterium]